MYACMYVCICMYANDLCQPSVPREPCQMYLGDPLNLEDPANESSVISGLWKKLFSCSHFGPLILALRPRYECKNCLDDCLAQKKLPCFQSTFIF